MRNINSVGDDGNVIWIQGCSENKVLLIRVGYANRMLNIRKEELQQFIHMNASRVSEAKQ